MKLKILFLAAFTCLITACHSLAPGGVYQSQTLYNADLTIATGYEMVHSFVTWEFQNREALASNPSIKATADKFRGNAQHWFRTAVILRDTYANSATDANKTALDGALDVIRAAVREATTMLATTKIPNLTPEAQ